MDPNETRKLMREAVGAKEWEVCQAMAALLINWLTIGGFPPHGQSRAEALFEARCMLRKAKGNLEAEDGKRAE